VDATNQWVEVALGDSCGWLPLAGMRWARKPKPTENWEFHKVNDVKSVLKKGDVVLARPYYY
jgi:hypothetical protein